MHNNNNNNAILVVSVYYDFIVAKQNKNEVNSQQSPSSILWRVDVYVLMFSISIARMFLQCMVIEQVSYYIHQSCRKGEVCGSKKILIIQMINKTYT